MHPMRNPLLESVTSLVVVLARMFALLILTERHGHPTGRQLVTCFLYTVSGCKLFKFKCKFRLPRIQQKTFI